MCCGQSVNQTLNPCRVWPAELAVLEIEIVNDFRQRPERGILEREPQAHGLERAAVAFVREVGANHVERSLAPTGWTSRRIDEAKSRRGIDEPANEPGRGQSVDVRITTGDPHTALEVARRWGAP